MSLPIFQIKVGSNDVIFQNENFNRNELNLANTVTSKWSQNATETRILAFVAKESFICNSNTLFNWEWHLKTVKAMLKQGNIAAN